MVECVSFIVFRFEAIFISKDFFMQAEKNIFLWILIMEKSLNFKIFGCFLLIEMTSVSLDKLFANK